MRGARATERCGRRGAGAAVQVGRDVHDQLAVDDELVVRALQVAGKGLFTAEVKVDGLRDGDVDDAEEALILLLELLLVEDLDREDARVLDVDVKRLVPVWERGKKRSAQPLPREDVSPSAAHKG